MTRRKDKDKKGSAPKKRSPVPPPGYVLDTGKRKKDRTRKSFDESLDAAEEQRPVGMKSHTLHIQAGDVETTAQLNDSATAAALWESLPITGHAKRWGDEIYFEIPLTCPPEEPQAQVPAGTIAYWPEGDCFCIFFGQTPYSPVNVLGAVACDPALFRSVEDGQRVQLSRRGSKASQK